MNPFRDGIVGNPWETTGVDVNSIHDGVFQACLNGIEHVRKTQRSAALLIHGAAGSGKTHLLRRLRAFLAPQVPPSTEHPECLFVWVRLQTSPRMIWRTVRRTLVEDWFRPVRGAKTQFERILFHRLAEIRVANGDLERWYEFMLEQHPDGLRELLDQIAVSLHLDRNTAVAFEHIAFHRHLRDLRAWLSGDLLPEAALARMDLSQEEGTDEEREEQSRQIVMMLCRLAGDTLPILISFDQVEALEMFPGDRDGLYAFGHVTSSLHDGATNVFIVSCVQSAFYTELRSKAREADYHRMISQGALSLDPLNRTQAEQLISARLKNSDVTIPAAASSNPCWPISPAELDSLFDKEGAVTPRKLLSLCAERYEASLNPAPTADSVSVPDQAVRSDSPQQNEKLVGERAVSAYLGDQWAALCEAKLKDNSEAKTEDIVRHALPLLFRLSLPTAKAVNDKTLQDVTLQYEKEGKKTGLSICTSPNMTSLAAQLKRLKAQAASPALDRLGILRDGRVPISSTAKVVKQTLEELEKNPKVFIFRPSPEALAALDALRILLTDAKSGDLSFHGEPISAQTLEQWLCENLPDRLRDLVDDVFLNSTATDSARTLDGKDLESLCALLNERSIVALNEAATVLKKSRETLLDLARKYPDQVGLIEGDPETLFRPVRTGESRD